MTAVDEETKTPEQPDAPARRGGPRLPLIPGPLETLGIAWRRLRKMSTAVILLLGMAIASILATFVPQAPNVPQTVASWLAGTDGPGAGVAAVLDALDLFDVFGSGWFTALLVLLFTSLTGCLIPRVRAFLKVVRRPPAAGRNLARLSNHVVITTPLEPDAALAVAERVLRSRRFRVRVVHDQVAAERGHWREGGSLVFHVSFYVLLVGIVVGQVFGFTGQVNVAEGEAFADSGLGYDQKRPGRAWGVEDHTGFTVALDDFTVDYFDGTNSPQEFTSTVTIDGQRTATVRVNHPITVEGMRVYQQRFGFAPVVEVRTPDRVLFRGPVQLGPVREVPGAWAGVARVDFDKPDQQIALDLILAPDAQLVDGEPVVGQNPRPQNPVLVATVFFGALGLERPIPAAQFDRSQGPIGPPAMLRPGAAADVIPDELTVQFVDLRYWSGFQVSHQPGRFVLLLAGTLILTGLVPSLYAYRRRVWAQVQGADEVTRVVLAGVALQRTTLFSEAFAEIAEELTTALEGST